jgi:hypothetical protein
MKYTVEMASDGMTYTPSLMTIGSCIRIILRVTSIIVRLECLFTDENYAILMVPDVLIYIPSFINTGSAIQKLRRGHRDTDTQTGR